MNQISRPPAPPVNGAVAVSKAIMQGATQALATTVGVYLGIAVIAGVTALAGKSYAAVTKPARQPDILDQLFAFHRAAQAADDARTAVVIDDILERAAVEADVAIAEHAVAAE